MYKVEFKKHFAHFHDKYVLIGGTACMLVMEEAGIPFRATKDLDIVLCVEALNKEFVFAFKEFVKQGNYQNRQQSTGPPSIKSDLKEFFQRVEIDSIDLKTLWLKNTTYEKVLNSLKIIYNIAPLPSLEEA